MSLNPTDRLRIESLAVCDDDRREARTLIAEWEQRFPGDCPVQAAWIEQALTALVDLRRCRRTRAALLDEKRRTALRRWENEQEDRILLCLRTLNAEPYQGMTDFVRFAAGVRHLIGRWTRIEAAFARDLALHGDMIWEAIQMQGHSARISELVLSEDAYLTWIYCLMARAEPDPEESERLWCTDAMPLSIQTNPPQPWPPSREYCQEQIRKLIVRELTRLRALETTLRLEVEEPARAAALELALAQTTKEESQLLRAERHHERSLQQAERALLALGRQAPARLVVDESWLIAQLVSDTPGPEPEPASGPEPPEPPRTVTSQSLAAAPKGGTPLRIARSFAYTLAGKPAPVPLPHDNERTTMDEQEDELRQECMKTLPPSPARSEAARINGSKSHGPVSAAGKLAARLGGLVHAMASELPILPGESEEELNALVETFNTDYNTTNESERELAAVAAHSIWKARRCRDADAAATSKKMGIVVDEHADRQAREVARLVPMLETNASEAVRQLRTSCQGIAYLLGQVAILEERLAVHRSYEPSQRLLAIRISGYDPRTILTEPAVTKLDLAYIAALRGRGDSNAAQVAAILQDDRPEGMTHAEFERRLGCLMAGLGTIAEGHTALKQHLADLRQDLKDRFELVDGREARNLAFDFRTAKVDISADGMLRLRYETAHLRRYHAAVCELRRLQELRNKEGVEAASDEAPLAARKQEGTKLRTEPKGSEPVGPEFPAGPAASPGVDGVVGGAPGVAAWPSG